MQAIRGFAQELWEELSSSSSSDDEGGRSKKEKQKSAEKKGQAKCQKQEGDRKDGSTDQNKDDAVRKEKEKEEEGDDDWMEEMAVETIADIFTGGIYGFVSSGIEVAEALQEAKAAKMAEADNGNKSQGNEKVQVSLTAKEVARCVANTLSDGAYDSIVEAIRERRSRKQREEQQQGSSEKQLLTAEEADTVLHEALTQEQINEVTKSLELLVVEKGKKEAEKKENE